MFNMTVERSLGRIVWINDNWSSISLPRPSALTDNGFSLAKESDHWSVIVMCLSRKQVIVGEQEMLLYPFSATDVGSPIPALSKAFHPLTVLPALLLILA